MAKRGFFSSPLRYATASIIFFEYVLYYLVHTGKKRCTAGNNDIPPAPVSFPKNAPEQADGPFIQNLISQTIVPEGKDDELSFPFLQRPVAFVGLWAVHLQMLRRGQEICLPQFDRSCD